MCVYLVLDDTFDVTSYDVSGKLLIVVSKKISHTQKLEPTCAFLRNATLLPETPLVVRASCCAVAEWGFISFFVAIAVCCCVLVWWIPGKTKRVFVFRF
jgi:hypothetical protein